MSEQWVDVGGLLQAAQSEMGVNDLVQTPMFSLFEAMSAVEIGNVKMDAGATRPQSLEELMASGVGPVELSPPQACAVMDHLLQLEATHYGLGIAAAASLYSSVHMMQPHRLDASCPALAALCRGVEATCLAVRFFIMNGAVSEDEDINVMVMGLPLEDAAAGPGTALAPSGVCLPALAAAQQQQELAAAAPGASEADRQACARMALHLAFRHSLLQALLRLQEKSPAAVAVAQPALVDASSYLRTLLASPRPTPPSSLPASNPGPSAAASTPSASSAAASSAAAASDPAGVPTGSGEQAGPRTAPSGPAPATPAAASQQASGGQPEAASSGRGSAGQAAAPAPGPAASSSSSSGMPGEAAGGADAGAHALLGYAPGMNQRLLAPAPPRAAQVMTEAEAAAFWSAVVQHLQAAASVSKITGWRALQQHVQHLAGLRMGVLARSVAHFLLAGKAWGPGVAGQPAAPGMAPLGTAPAPSSPAAKGGSGAAKAASKPQAEPAQPAWVLDRPMICEGLALPLAKPLGPEVDMFLEQAVIAVGNWVQAMLLNPCRQRRRLRRGLEDLANLYQHALNADMHPPFKEWMASTGWQWEEGQAGPPDPVTGAPDLQGVLATWVEAEIIQSQGGHLLAGFRLELHAPPEFAMIYWYVSSLMASRRQALQQLHMVQAPAAGMRLLPAAGGKGKKAVRPPPLDAATVRRQAGLLADALLAEQYSVMASGLVRLMAGLQACGLVKGPALPFSTAREQFDQRFGSFHAPNLVKPLPMTYDQFEASMQLGPQVTVQVLFQLAMETFSQLRRTIASLKAQLAAGAAGGSLPALGDALTADQLNDLTCLDRVAATNGLASSILLKSIPAADAAGKTDMAKPTLSVKFEFTVHPYFPTVGVKSVSSTAPAKAAA